MSDIRYINCKLLEALKPMGRIDGDGVTSDTGYEVAVEWRKECEGLRDKIAQLEALVACSRRGEVEKAEEIKRLRGLVTQLQDERRGWLDRCKANDATYDSLQREHRELQAEHEHLRAVGGFPGMVKEIEALHIIIKHMAPLL